MYFFFFFFFYLFIYFFFLVCAFQKKSVIFWSKNGKYPTQIRAFNFTIVAYPMYWTFKITLSSIGFEWEKSVDLLVSELFLCCDSSKGKGFRFPPV